MLLLSLTSLKIPQHKAEGIELRLDCMSTIDRTALRAFLLQVDQPVMLTLRKTSQGGLFTGSEEQRLAYLEDLLYLHPSFVDIEYDTEPAFVERIANKFPETKIILSYHNFDNTPDNLPQLLKGLHSPYAYGYKIATYARSSLDALKMLLFAKNNKQVATLCMGEDGAITRILSPVFGSLFSYTYTDRQTAPGQISLHELMSIYNYARLQPSTQLFGLIGDPVEQSIGHIVHNAAAKALEWDAVYVKMRITQEELPEFFTLATQCGFKGLSVTAPLKEKIFPHKAINTLVWKEDKVQGYNTDGTGCLDALELHTSVYKKRIMILGAGGAAQAIAKEACARGALVTLYNRSKAQAVANKIGCFASERVENYDILINATSSLAPISSDAIIPGSYVMDIHTTPALPPLLIEAKKKGCPIIPGLEMFLHQGAQQLRLWSQKDVSPSFLCNLYKSRPPA